MSKSPEKPKKQQKQKPQKTLKERRSERRAAKRLSSGSFLPSDLGEKLRGLEDRLTEVERVERPA